MIIVKFPQKFNIISRPWDIKKLGGKVYPFDDNKTRGGGQLVQTIFLKKGLKLPYFKECFGISIFIPQVIAFH